MPLADREKTAEAGAQAKIERCLATRSQFFSIATETPLTAISMPRTVDSAMRTTRLIYFARAPPYFLPRVRRKHAKQYNNSLRHWLSMALL